MQNLKKEHSYEPQDNEFKILDDENYKIYHDENHNDDIINNQQNNDLTINNCYLFDV